LIPKTVLTGELAANPHSWVVVDIETTGLRKSDEIIEVAVIDGYGTILLHKRLCPAIRTMEFEAKEKHGISLAMLEGEPVINDIYSELVSCLSGKRVIAYNAEFAMRLFQQTCKKFNPDFPYVGWDSAMQQYSQYIGQRMEKSHDNFPYRYQKLPGTENCPTDDCQIIWGLIFALADKRLKEPSFFDAILAFFSAFRKELNTNQRTARSTSLRKRARHHAHHRR
jgi:hypothetical protein